MRALRSPAISERDSVINVVLKLSLNPRTPTKAATPTATDNTTNANFPGADFRSRHAIAEARLHPSARLANCVLAWHCDFRPARGRKSVFDDQTDFLFFFLFGVFRNLRVE